MAAPARASVVGADYVAVDVRGSMRTFKSPLRVDVSGFSRNLSGNGYRPGQPGPITTFSFGFESPQRVDVYLADGRRLVGGAATRAIFGGGRLIDPSTPPPRPPAPARPMPSIPDDDPPSSSEIIEAGDNEAHIIDNGASLEMADRMHSGPDDFDETVRARNQAMGDADGDDLAAGAILQHSAVDAVQSQAPLVSTNPPSAITSLLGGQATLSPPPIGEGPALIEVARWNGADHESENVIITLGPAQVAAPIQGSSVVDLQSKPFARLQWGTRGFALSADIDIGNGQQFTIGASYVSLAVGMEPLVPIAGGGVRVPTGVPQKLTGMLSFGHIERHGVALTRTLQDNNVPGASDIIFRCPPFAKAIIAAGISVSPVYIYPRDMMGRQLGSTSLTVAVPDSWVTTTIVLPGNTFDIQFSSGVPGSSVGSGTLVFALGL